MKLSVVDAQTVVMDRVREMAGDLPYTFNTLTFVDSSKSSKGDLLKQNDPFLIVDIVPGRSQRVGPSKVSPTRYFYTLYLTYMTKGNNHVKDAKLLEQIGEWFREQTVDGIRFRTFTPYPIGNDQGFTYFQCMIPFDFELYRGP